MVSPWIGVSARLRPAAGHPTSSNSCCILFSQVSVPRDALPPTPPGPEGSNGNGLLRVQWVAGAWLFSLVPLASAPPHRSILCIRLDIVPSVVQNSWFLLQLESPIE